MRWIDALAWSGLWLAVAAAALVAASSRAIGIDPAPVVMALAAGGTLAVYGTDRLRDRVRDRGTAPERAAFVERHRAAITFLAAAGGLAAAASALAAGPQVAALAALVAALGLLHRRLKRWTFAKPVYLTFAWTAVAVGLPAAYDAAALHRAWAAGVVATTILANVALSNLRDAEGLAGRFGRTRTLRVASAILTAGLAAAVLGPPTVRPLAVLPAAMAAAVWAFRPSERYGALAVDGALLAGAVLALWLART
jgi:hypothetical protein